MYFKPNSKLPISSFVIAAVCVICYYNSCNCGFVFDDISAIKDNKDIKPNTPITNLFFNDFWGTPIRREQSHKSYRPLTVLTFRLNYYIHQMDPFGYHLINLILHIVVCLLYKRMTNIFLANDVSVLASVLFAVHPIHTEAVTGVVGRAEILSSIFFMCAFLIYNRMAKSRNGWRWAFPFIGSITCAVLCKEQGITVSGICIVYEIFIINKLPLKIFLSNMKSLSRKLFNFRNTEDAFVSSSRRIIFLVIVTGFLLGSRLYIMGRELPTFTRFDNPASAETFPAKYLTWSYLVYLNIVLLIFPSNLCCDWTMGTVPVIHSIYDIRNLATLITISIFVVLFLLIYKYNGNSSKALLMGLSWMILPFLPASNLFFPVGFVIAERVLYMPSMGYCLIISHGSMLLWKRYNVRTFKILPLFLIVIHGLKTFHRNIDWRTEYTIFIAGIKVTQNNAKLFNNVGHALENEENHFEALGYFKKAVQVQNDDIGAYINVGRAYKNLQRYDEAEKVYNIAKDLFPKPKPGEAYLTRIAPYYLNVFLNLANLISLNETRLEEADSLYREAISLRADYVQAYINRGDILMKLNKSTSALHTYETALKYENDNPDIHYNIGVVLLELGKVDEALASFEKALQINSEHQQALLNSAILLQESGKPDKIPTVKFRLLKLMEINDSNDRVLFNLGMLAMDENETDKAVAYFKRAVELNPSFKSALFNLALLLADTKRSTEALPFLHQLVKYHPDHVKGLILLGEIYLNHLKNLEAAEKSYRRILEIEPQNIQGLHNLCVVYVEKNNLKKALTCLEKVHALAPHEDYIVQHLKIVRARLQKNDMKSVT